jgi:hypothetical protein
MMMKAVAAAGAMATFLLIIASAGASAMPLPSQVVRLPEEELRHLRAAVAFPRAGLGIRHLIVEAVGSDSHYGVQAAVESNYYEEKPGFRRYFLQWCSAPTGIWQCERTVDRVDTDAGPTVTVEAGVTGDDVIQIARFVAWDAGRWRGTTPGRLLLVQLAADQGIYVATVKRHGCYHDLALRREANTFLVLNEDWSGSMVCP